MKNKVPLLRLLKDCKKQWGWMMLFILFYLLAGLFRSLLALLFGKMTDITLTQGVESTLQYIVPLSLILGLDWMRGSLAYIVSAQTTERMFLHMKVKMFDKLAHLKVSVLENKLRSGDVVTRMNNDLNTLCEDIAGRYTWFLRVIFTALIAFIACVYLSWQLSLVYFILMPPVFFIIKEISKPIKDKQKAISQNMGKSMNITNELLSGLVVSKSYGLEDEMSQRFDSFSDEAARTEIENEKLNVKMIAVKYIGMIFPMVMMLFAGILLVSRGIITPGAVIAFAGLCGQVQGLLDLSDTMLRTYRSSTATCERIYEVLDMEEESFGEATNAEIEKMIYMDNISFAYEGKEKVFENFSIKIKTGQKIAFVGSSGCGKSTLLKLICKFYEIEKGEYKIFGTSIADWSNVALRSHIALVSQDAFLFQDSIYENVKIGRPQATEQEIVEALKKAHIWNFVESLEEKMHTKVGEGGMSLSGGQGQRIAIARTILKDADLVLLDEPTSALDMQSEQEVQKALDALLEEKTAIVVAHRLYTLKNMDCIYFLDKGTIIEHGNWNDLCEKRGKFYQLLEIQKKGDAK